jgi:heme A synthase
MTKNVGHIWLIASGLLFGLYCLNVALGKIAISSGEPAFFSLGDVGEFLVLFAAVLCFVVTMLEREAYRDSDPQDQN